MLRNFVFITLYDCRFLQCRLERVRPGTGLEDPEEEQMYSFILSLTSVRDGG
jgi:hypothetical protein